MMAKGLVVDPFLVIEWKWSEMYTDLLWMLYVWLWC